MRVRSPSFFLPNFLRRQSYLIRPVQGRAARENIKGRERESETNRKAKASAEEARERFDSC